MKCRDKEFRRTEKMYILFSSCIYGDISFNVPLRKCGIGSDPDRLWLKHSES